VKACFLWGKELKDRIITENLSLEQPGSSSKTELPGVIQSRLKSYLTNSALRSMETSVPPKPKMQFMGQVQIVQEIRRLSGSLPKLLYNWFMLQLAAHKGNPTLLSKSLLTYQEKPPLWKTKATSKNVLLYLPNQTPWKVYMKQLQAQLSWSDTPKSSMLLNWNPPLLGAPTRCHKIPHWTSSEGSVKTQCTKNVVQNYLQAVCTRSIPNKNECCL
jgi:hypothetical protein